MEDPDPRVQEEAVDTLAGLEDAEGLATLMRLAQSHPRTTSGAKPIEALAHRASDPDQARDSSIVDLLEKLARTDGEIEVQLEAVETLGEIPGPTAAGRLRELARAHPDERVRAEAIESLGGSAARRRPAALLKRIALADQSARVQDEAIETLAELPTAPASTRSSSSRATTPPKASASMRSRRCSKAIIRAPASCSTARWAARPSGKRRGPIVQDNRQRRGSV